MSSTISLDRPGGRRAPLVERCGGLGGPLRARRADNSELPPIEVGPTIAISPVVLAVPKSLATAATTGTHAWIDGLASLPVSAADTRQSTPTALAFAAV